MLIKNIVISAGGAKFFALYGAVKQAHIDKLWHQEHLESIHATSAGSMVAALMLLRDPAEEWRDTDDFLIKRNLEKIFQVTPDNMFGAYSKCGVFGKSVFKTLVKPFLAARDLSTTVTLKEFYDFTKVDFHIYITELNTFQSVALSHTTHPDLELVKAIYMSSAIPPVFKPVFERKSLLPPPKTPPTATEAETEASYCYMDGGVFAYYPVDAVIRTDISQDSILGFRVHRGTNHQTGVVNEKSNLLSYMFSIFQKFINHTVNAENNLLNHCIKNEIVIDIDKLRLGRDAKREATENDPKPTNVHHQSKNIIVGNNSYTISGPPQEGSMIEEWKQIIGSEKHRRGLIEFGMAAARGSFINTSKKPSSP